MLSLAVIESGDKAVHRLVSSSLTSYRLFDLPIPHFEGLVVVLLGRRLRLLVGRLVGREGPWPF